jgi:hypothetical protein
MSIHGNQFLFPLFLRKSPSLPSIEDNEELTLAFYLLTKDLKSNEKIISFSRLLWPLLSIQGVISTHMILDGLKIFSKKGKFSNPPRQPLIGHILRNIDNRTEIEILNRTIDVLTYKDIEAEEIGTGEESEYQTLTIEGLINPEYLQSLLKLIPLLEYLPIKNYVPLDSSLSTESALDISEGYRKIIDTMKGNAYRWDTQANLIEKEINKWIKNLTAKLKDINMRYSSQISKTSRIINDVQMRKQIELENDKIDQWKVKEKKNLIENISVLFKTVERNLQEIIKKNRFFSTEETLKSKVFKDLLPPFEKHFVYLKEEGKRFLDSIEALHQKYNDLKMEAVRIDSKAKSRLEEFEKALNLKLQNRDKQLFEFEREKKEKISELKKFQIQIENLFGKIKEILQTKAKNCLQEAEDLIGWTIKDTQDELFAKPIQWIYIPLYVMFIEDEDLIEEHMNIIFPGYVGDINSLYKDLTDSFVKLKFFLNEKIEEDIKIRSNFEFSSDRKNLIKDPNIKKKIQMGIKNLRNISLLDDVIEAKIRENLNLI